MAFDDRIRFISDPAVVATTLRAFHARAEKRRFPSGSGYSMDHTAVLYALAPDRQVNAALPETSVSLADDLVAALTESPASSREPASRG
jgi:cytochrome oxidase Cu insertion factor (SCO1/SenC/PrrC family)